MCNASDVATYILQEKGRLSGYQLQKLLYYAQAWCLVVQDRPLFDDEVRAWEHGPVVYSVFSRHSGKRSVVASDIGGDPSAVSLRDRAVIDPVVESYGTLSGDDLESLSHSEDPWADSYNGRSGLASSVITEDAMRKYYSALSVSSRVVRDRHHAPDFSQPEVLYVNDAEYDWLVANM